MQIKKALIFMTVVLLIMFAAGCNSRGTAPVQRAENNQQGVDIENGDSSRVQEADLEYGEITDPVELEKLWQDYLYDTITTLGNASNFNSAEEIEPFYVAKYCWYNYAAEHGEEGLELANENSLSGRFFPLETVLEYAGRYFNLDSLDVTAIEGHYYNPEKCAFIFSYNRERDRPSHTDRNPWGIHLHKVTRNRDGTITAVLVNYDSYRTRRVEKTRTYILKPRQDGSLYFVSGHQEYVNNNLVRLEGNYRRFDKIAGFEGNLSELSMLGENDGRIIFANTPYDKNKNATLILLNPASMKLEQELDTGVNFSRTDVRLNGDKIVVCLNDKIIVIDKSLKERAEVSLPQGLKDKIEREPQYDQYGFPDVYFGGYDVSSDFKRFVYADEQGLKLINIADSSEILLAPTVPITGSKLLKNYYHSSPRFVADGQKVISTLLGYESAVGYTLCNLEEGTYRTYDFASEAASTAFIRYDTGLLEINTYIRPNGKQTGEYKTLFLDFYTGEVKEIELKDPGETGYIVFPEACYVGLDYAAFITCEFDDNDYANNMSYLNRLNLKTLAVEDKIVTVKAANTSILGVLADGRILFWYSLNPSEEGIGITE